MHSAFSLQEEVQKQRMIDSIKCGCWAEVT